MKLQYSEDRMRVSEGLNHTNPMRTEDSEQDTGECTFGGSGSFSVDVPVSGFLGSIHPETRYERFQKSGRSFSETRYGRKSNFGALIQQILLFWVHSRCP